MEKDGRTFECKTCGRQFATFQALGGHRTGHSRGRELGDGCRRTMRPRLHACSVCGLAFPMGQALGGHMRRHKVAVAKSKSVAAADCAKQLQWLDLNLPPLENELQLGSHELQVVEEERSLSCNFSGYSA